MSNFTEFSPFQLDSENFFNDISKEWILLSAKSSESGRINMMTASWGGIGFIWNRAVCTCFVRPQRFSYGIFENSDYICFNFMGEKYRDAMNFCGAKSGRDFDKVAETGLTPVEEGGAVYFDEARLTVIGKKIYVSDLHEEGFIDKSIIPQCYPKKDYHRMYVCEIQKVLKRKSEE